MKSQKPSLQAGSTVVGVRRSTASVPRKNNNSNSGAQFAVAVRKFPSPLSLSLRAFAQLSFFQLLLIKLTGVFSVTHETVKKIGVVNAPRYVHSIIMSLLWQSVSQSDCQLGLGRHKCIGEGRLLLLLLSLSNQGRHCIRRRRGDAFANTRAPQFHLASSID